VIEKEKQKKRGYAQPLFLHFWLLIMSGVVADINPLLVLIGAGPHDKVL
jgi:hypothetical protein